MDDLKLSSESKAQLVRLIEITNIFNMDIKMKVGLEKCAIVSLRAGKILYTKNIKFMIEKSLNL